MEQTEITSYRDQSTMKTRGNSADSGEDTLKHRVLQHLSWLLVLAVVLVFGVLYLLSEGFRDQVAETWDVLSSGNQEVIRDYIRSYGGWAPLASVLLMVSQVVIAPVPASVIQLSNGVVFGVVGGAVLNLIGQMAGATIAFFIARSLGRKTVERLAGRVDESGVIENWIDRWGGKALLLVRMIPGMPSDFVSYLMGLTPMGARRYLTVSFLGYIPQSIAYAWLGDYATDWFWWIVLGGFGISAVIGLVVWGIRQFGPKSVTRAKPALKVKPESDVC